MRISKVKDSSNGDWSIEMNPNSNASIFTPTAQPHVCKETCLHSVAQSGDPSKLSAFVNSKRYKNGEEAELNEADNDGRTALHWVNSIKCSCNKCSEEAEECLKCLLHYEQIGLNCQDSQGNTPLHLAIQCGNTKCARLLLQRGADVSIKNKVGEEPLSLIVEHCADVMVAVLNQAVNVDKYYPNSKDCVLRLDFGAVTGYSESDTSLTSSYHRELTLLSSVLCTNKGSRQKILTHPLVVLFLDQKWRRVRKYFALLFFCYLFWLLSYTSFIIKVYVISCPCPYFSKNSLKSSSGHEKDFNAFGEEELQESNQCHLETGFTFDTLFVILMTVGMAINEILKVIMTPWLYLKNKLNLGSWVLIVMVILTTGPIIMEKNSMLMPWQFQAAALAIFLSWAFILGQLGTFPSLGRYVEILGHVLKNFGLSMLTFSSLFMAFALSFNVLFPGTEPFSHFFFAIIKCIVMFTGEVDYKDMFYNNEKDSTTGPIVGHLLYAAFVLIITIVLMNLLVGLTVSDIQALQKEAELTRVFRQISEMLNLELACFSNKLPPVVNRFLQRTISVTGHKKHGGEVKDRSDDSQPFLNNLMFYVRPNDPSDKTVSEKLKEVMLRIAANNYHRQSSTNLDRTHHSEKVLNFDAN